MELETFVEDNLDKITVVDDLFHLPDFNFHHFDNDLNMNEDKLYRNMHIFKKFSQILLNMYQSQNEYHDCEILEYQFLDSVEHDDPYFNIDYKNSNKQCLIKIICCYIKYNRILQSIEIEKEYDLYNLMEGSCLYCDSPLEENNFCSCCQASNNDFRSYIQLHKNTLKREKSKGKESEIRINEEEKKRIDSWGIQNSCRIKITMSSKRTTIEINEISKGEEVDGDNEMKWTCSMCGLINTENFCQACLKCKPMIISTQNESQSFVQKSRIFDSNFRVMNDKCDQRLLFDKKNNKLFDPDTSWQCILPNCNFNNSEKDSHCKKCGLNKYGEEAKLLYQIITVWTCKSCYTVFKSQSGLCRNHCKINHYGGNDVCTDCKPRFKGECRECSRFQKSLFYATMTSL